MQSPMAVVETETFLTSAARLGISETERTTLIIYLAGNPASWLGRARDRRGPETPMGASRTRQVRRRTSDLLLPQQIDPAVRA